MIDFFEIIKRALEGPYYSERDFDLKVMVPTEDVLDDGEGPRRFLVGEASGRTDWNDKIAHAARVGAAAAGVTMDGRMASS